MIFNEEILKHFIKSQGLLELNQNRSSHLNILKKAKDLGFEEAEEVMQKLIYQDE